MITFSFPSIIIPILISIVWLKKASDVEGMEGLGHVFFAILGCMVIWTVWLIVF